MQEIIRRDAQYCHTDHTRCQFCRHTAPRRTRNSSVSQVPDSVEPPRLFNKTCRLYLPTGLISPFWLNIEQTEFRIAQFFVFLNYHKFRVGFQGESTNSPKVWRQTLFPNFCRLRPFLVAPLRCDTLKISVFTTATYLNPIDACLVSNDVKQKRSKLNFGI